MHKHVVKSRDPIRVVPSSITELRYLNLSKRPDGADIMWFVSQSATIARI